MARIASAILVVSFMTSSPFDHALQWLGLALCASLLLLLVIKRVAPKFRMIRWFLAYSLAVTALLTVILHFDAKEYRHAYWIAQGLSYLLEISLSVELARMVIVKNWHVMTIFAPFIFAGGAFSLIAYGIPQGFSDVTRLTYVCTMLSGFVLLLVWLFEGRLEGKLEQPYSGIAFVFTCYMAARFAITYIHSYYQSKHWAITGKFNPINEDLLLVGWLVVVLVYERRKKLTKVSAIA